MLEFGDYQSVPRLSRDSLNTIVSTVTEKDTQNPHLAPTHMHLHHEYKPYSHIQCKRKNQERIKQFQMNSFSDLVLLLILKAWWLYLSPSPIRSTLDNLFDTTDVSL